MNEGKLCPACGREIGIWPVFSASMPNRIWCPACKARLQYRHTTGLVLFLIVLVLAVAGIAGFAAISLPTSSVPIKVLVFGLVSFGSWCPLELGVTWYLRNRKTLVMVEKPDTLEEV